MADFIIPVPIEPKPRFDTETWSLRDYWVEPPKIIPKRPQQYVPQADTIAFGEQPRATESYQDHPLGLYPRPPVKPPAPPTVGSNATPRFDPPWALRDYTTRIEPFSTVFTPKLPPPFPAGAFPMWFTRWYYPWSIADYQSLQDNFSWIGGIQPANTWVPGAEQIVFGELPPDQTALKMSVDKPVRFDRLISASLIVPPVKRFAFAERPRDLTPLLLSQFAYTAFSGIPVVPTYAPFPTYDYEAEDQTALQLAARVITIPPPRIPFIFPVPQPYLEPPPWTLREYPSLQDRFTATAPGTAVYPKGLVPRFPIEALIRDIPRPLIFPQTFRLPPPPPRVIPTPATILLWKDWALRDYDSGQSQFAPILSTIPPIPPFEVMAVTAGWYNGTYYYPGDTFMLLKASDFSDASFNYGPLSATVQYGWMKRSSAPLFSTENTMAPPNFPVIDPIPPKRFVY